MGKWPRYSFIVNLDCEAPNVNLDKIGHSNGPIRMRSFKYSNLSLPSLLACCLSIGGLGLRHLVFLGCRRGGGGGVQVAVRRLAVADEARPEVDVDHREVHCKVQMVQRVIS